MKIAVIGTGALGQRLARGWQAAGQEVRFGTRTPDAAPPPLAPGVPRVTAAEAGAWAETIVLAVPWYAFTDVERDLGPLAGKLVIDPMNPLLSSGSLALGHKTSAAELVATAFPRAHVVKAFNHLYSTHLDDPLFDGAPADAFFCGDDPQARAQVADLAAALGLNPVDCGPLKMARHLEPLAALWLQMAFHFGRGPGFTFRLVTR